MRSDEPGWLLAAMHDPSGRRGLWYRVTYREPAPANPATSRGRTIVSVEVCGGREGDDAYASFSYAAPVTPEMLCGLEDALGRCEWMCEAFYEERDADRRDDPTVAAIMATARERDDARSFAFESREAGLAECERLRATLAAIRDAVEFDSSGLARVVGQLARAALESP